MRKEVAAFSFDLAARQVFFSHGMYCPVCVCVCVCVLPCVHCVRQREWMNGGGATKVKVGGV